MPGRPLDLNEVAEAHPQHVTVKVQTAVKVVHNHDHMPQTERSPLETGNRTRRLKGQVEGHQRTVENFRGDPAGVLESEQVHHPPGFGFCLGALLDLYAGGCELLGHCPQRVLVLHFPTDIG